MSRKSISKSIKNRERSEQNLENFENLEKKLLNLVQSSPIEPNRT